MKYKYFRGPIAITLSFCVQPVKIIIFLCYHIVIVVFKMWIEIPWQINTLQMFITWF